MRRFLTEVLTWRNHEWIRPVVRTAIAMGRPPLMFLLEDPAHTSMTRWDLKLINAFHMLETYEVDGQPIWFEESRDVEFVAKKKVYRAAKALETAQDRDQKARTDSKGNTRPAHGERWHVEPKFVNGVQPTFRDWINQQSTGANETSSLIDTPDEELTKAERREKIALQRMAAIRASRNRDVQ